MEDEKRAPAEERFPGWRQGAILIVPARCSLAMTCFRCGARPVMTSAQSIAWHPAAATPLIILTGLVSSAAAREISERAEFEFGLCELHATQHRRKRRIGWSIVALAPLCLLLAVALGSLTLGLVAPFVLLAGALVLAHAARVVKVDRISDNLAWISNASPALLASLDDRRAGDR